MRYLSVCLEIAPFLFCLCVSVECFQWKPKNMAVIAGQRMEMECRTDNESKVLFWYFVSSGSNKTPVTLVTNIGSKPQLNENFSSGFGVDFDENGSGIIYFNSTTIDNAGIYICEVEKGSNIVKYSAQLIVFESEPICETNLTEDSSLSFDEIVWLRCLIEFRGNWTPSVQWIRSSVVDELNDTLITNSSCISSTLTVVARNNSVYSFKVFFDSSNVSFKTNATNTPDFTFTWNSPYIFVTAMMTSSTTSVVSNGTIATDFLYLIVIIVISVFFFILSLLIAIVCWITVRKKTAEWMADFVSSYENLESRARVHGGRNSTIANQQPHCSEDDLRVAADDLTVGQNNRPTSGGYTDPYDLSQDYNEAFHNNEGTSALPKYSQDEKKKTDNLEKSEILVSNSAAAAAAAADNTSDALYATLRKGIEPPKCYSLYASGNCDSSDEEKKESTTEV